jgi:CRP/FNR family transcriptional regulator
VSASTDRAANVPTRPDLEGDDGSTGVTLQFLRRLCPGCDRLSDEQLADILPRLRTGSYRRREQLFLAGDPADRVFLVADGQFKSLATTLDGRDLIVEVAGPGQWLGEAALFYRLYPTTAEAVSEAAAVVFPRDVFDSLCETAPGFLMAVTAMLVDRLGRAQQQASSLISQSVSARLAALLLASGESPASPGVVTLSLTHLEMAQRIGSSRETVTAMLNRFRKLGFLEIDKREVRILDRNAFQACIEGRLAVSTRHPAPRPRRGQRARRLATTSGKAQR